jgi:hypothetical protein
MIRLLGVELLDFTLTTEDQVEEAEDPALGAVTTDVVGFAEPLSPPLIDATR